MERTCKMQEGTGKGHRIFAITKAPAKRSSIVGCAVKCLDQLSIIDQYLKESNVRRAGNCNNTVSHHLFAMRLNLI